MGASGSRRREVWSQASELRGRQFALLDRGRWRYCIGTEVGERRRCDRYIWECEGSQRTSGQHGICVVVTTGGGRKGGGSGSGSRDGNGDGTRPQGITAPMRVV